MKNIVIAFFILIGTVSEIANSDEIVALKDGREVRLRDNGTWEFLGGSTNQVSRNPFADAETREIVKKAADHMRQSLSTVRLSVELAILQFETGQDRSLKGLGLAYDEARGDFTIGNPLFESASARLVSNAKASEALNEVYIFWKASMDQANLGSQESLNRYKYRMDEREAGLREKRDRLDLALSYLSTAVPTVSEIKGEAQPARAAVPTELDPIKENLGPARIVCPEGIKEVPFSSMGRKTLRCGEVVTIAAQNKDFTRVKTSDGIEGYVSPKVLGRVK